MTETLIRRLISKTIASCQCMTKTPDPAHHKEDCLYRILEEAIIELQKPSEADLRTFGASDAVCYKYPGEDQAELRKAYLDGVHDSVKGCQDYGEDELTEKVAFAICVASGNDPDSMTYITDDGIQQPYGPRYLHHLPEAAAAINVVQGFLGLPGPMTIRPVAPDAGRPR